MLAILRRVRAKRQPRGGPFPCVVFCLVNRNENYYTFFSLCGPLSRHWFGKTAGDAYLRRCSSSFSLLRPARTRSFVPAIRTAMLVRSRPPRAATRTHARPWFSAAASERTSDCPILATTRRSMTPFSTGSATLLSRSTHRRTARYRARPRIPSSGHQILLSNLRKINSLASSTAGSSVFSRHFTSRLS